MSCLQFIAECEGERLDRWLCVQEPALTRSMIQKLISEGQVRVNGAVAVKSYALKSGDNVNLDIPAPVALDVKAEDLPVEIAYQDSDLLVVNKPKGMVVHPAAGNPDGTLVNALLFHCAGELSSINGVIRPGIVHRIDKDTSGLLIVAKTDLAHLGLAAQIKEHSFTREYEAIVCGHLREQEGSVNAPLGRSHADRKKMAVLSADDKGAKNAVTHYKALAEVGKFTHIRLWLETGRTHQIRVHMAYIGHAVLGDTVYGKPFKGANGQCLHAKKIGFIHPRTGEYMEFDSELPEYFQKLLSSIK